MWCGSHNHVSVAHFELRTVTGTDDDLVRARIANGASHVRTHGVIRDKVTADGVNDDAGITVRGNGETGRVIVGYLRRGAEQLALRYGPRRRGRSGSRP